MPADVSSIPPEKQAEFTAMVKALAKPGHEIVAGLTSAAAHRLHMAVGLAGEVGELISGWESGIHPNAKTAKGLLIKELGDIEFYYEGLLQGYGMPQPQIGIPPLPERSENVSRKLYVLAATILDLVKKEAFYGKPESRNELDQLLTTFRYTISLFYMMLRETRETVIDGNMAKLLKGKNARYATGAYSDAQAIARADTRE